MPLQCPACAGLVPLLNADRTSCPYCGGPVPIPAEYQQHKASLEALAVSQREARQLFSQLGRAPSRLFRAFAFFDSVWFWAVGLGFWITFALAAMVFLVPWVGAVIFKVNTVDVLSEQASAMLNLGGAMGSVVFGLLLSAWGRQRAISRGGLQAALAAQAPSAEGGPARCRVCGAALSFSAGALGARCDYCSADNLLKIPKEWAARMRALRRSVSKELADATRDWQAARRSLRLSLLVRLVLGSLVVGLPLALIGSAAPAHDLQQPDPGGPPLHLGQWTAEQAWTSPCTRGVLPVKVSDRCSGERCEAYLLAGLRHGSLEVFLEEVPEGSEVVLERHQQTFLSEVWTEVGRSAQRPSARLVVPLSGWYRLRYRVAAPPGTRVALCYQALPR